MTNLAGSGSDIPAEYEEILDPQGEPGDSSQPAPPPESSGGEPGAAAPPDDLVELYDGYRVDRATARSLAGFRDWMGSNPELAQTFVRYINGELDVVPKGAKPPEEPEEELPPQIRELDERLRRTETELTNQQTVMAESAMNRAKQWFVQERGLSEAEVDDLAATAAQMQVLPGIMQRLAREGRADAILGVQEALDVAFWSNQKYRQREMDKAALEAKDSQKRQRKMAGIAGTSGSVPRNQPQASTQAEKDAAMADMIRAAMEGRFSEEGAS